MNTKHTPGPWELLYTGEIWSNRGHIAKAPNQHPSDKANARLIAAAPDLLEAAEEIVNSAIRHQGSSDMRVTAHAMRLLQAAIAKATGNTNL